MKSGLLDQPLRGRVPARRSLSSRSGIIAVLGALALALVALSGCSSSMPSVSAPALRPAAPTAAPAASASSASKAGGAASNGSGSTEVLPADRMVIRNAKLTLRVENIEAALARVRVVADTYGGYVSSSHTWYEQTGSGTSKDRMAADITIAVRADAYDRAVQDLRQAAIKVDSEDGTSQDVTEEYVDLDSDLRNLQASQTALLKLMDKATRLEDVLTLQQQLSNVQGQIQRIEGRKRYLEHATSMSTISVSLRLPSSAVETPPVWSPLATFQKGWAASLVALQAVADVAILVVSFLWWLAPLAAVGYVLYRRDRARPRPSAPPPG